VCIVTSVQVEADEQKLTRLQTGTELVSAEEREKVEKVSAALPAGHARLHPTLAIPNGGAFTTC